MEKILITGADGFVGRHLVKALLEQGYEVCAVVHPDNKDVFAEYGSNSCLRVFSYDLLHVLNHISDFPKDIDTMYHFAWNGVRPELRDELDVQISNVDITLNCVKLASAINVKRVVFPGSTNEYLYYGKPLNKNAVPSPNCVYGAAKIALRYLCEEFCKKNGIEYIYTIIAGIYAEDRRDNNVIYYTIHSLLRGQKPSLTKLEQLWDYVYIDDVVDALILVGNKGKNLEVYPIGHGDNWELVNYIKIIHKRINPDLPLGIGEVPYSDKRMPCSCVDLSDTKRDTGFSPKVSFEEGISKVINRIKKEINHE